MLRAPLTSEIQSFGKSSNGFSRTHLRSFTGAYGLDSAGIWRAIVTNCFAPTGKGSGWDSGISMLWWTYQQLRVSSTKTRLAVVQKLAENRDPDAAGPLIFALKDKEADVRCAAAKALMQFDDRRAVDPLMKMLQEPLPASRAAAAETLGHLNDPVAVNSLVGLLRDQNSDVRTAAARSLDR